MQKIQAALVILLQVLVTTKIVRDQVYGLTFSRQ